jgi:hypothetical protein
MSEGEVFNFRAKGITVKITSEAVVIDNVAYPFMKPAAVFVRVEQPSRVGPLLVMGVGVSFFIERILEASPTAAIPAGFVAVVGAIWFKECKRVYCLDLAAVCNDRAPILRGSENWIAAVANAINEVMTRRTEALDAPEPPLPGESEASAPFLHPS